VRELAAVTSQHLLAAFDELLVAGEHAEAIGQLRGHAFVAGHRALLRAAHSSHELLVVVRGGEVAARVLVDEVRIHVLLQRERRFEPARIAVDFEEIDQPARHKGVVLEESLHVRVLAAPRAPHAAVIAPHLVEEESRVALRELPIPRGLLSIQPARRLREGGQHQPVPRRQNLVIEMRRDALLACLVEDALAALDRRAQLVLALATLLGDFRRSCAAA
jgi:hypothetical protein